MEKRACHTLGGRFSAENYGISICEMMKGGYGRRQSHAYTLARSLQLENSAVKWREEGMRGRKVLEIPSEDDSDQ